VLETFRYCQETGYEVDFIGVDEKGFIRLDELECKIRQDTALISIIMVNNETGAIQPVEEAARIKNSINRNTVLHADAVQAYGKIPINPGKSGIDMLSVSAHKIHGPKGIGILYASKNIRLKPILFGGGQESMLRSGTENVPGIAGFGLAADIKYKKLVTDAEQAAAVKSAFLKGLEGCSFDWRLVSPANSSPYIINVAFPGLRSEVLLHHLEEKNIFVSSGSACSSHKKSKSHVLQAMGLSNDITDSAIRFSLSGFNTIEEAQVIVKELEEIVPKITVNKTGRRKI
jgi:cysteine desulfurase